MYLNLILGNNNGFNNLTNLIQNLTSDVSTYKDEIISKIEVRSSIWYWWNKQIDFFDTCLSLCWWSGCLESSLWVVLRPPGTFVSRPRTNSDFFIDCTGFKRQLITKMGAKWAGARAEAARQPMHPSVMKLQGSVMCQSWQRPEPGARRCKCRYMWCPTSTVCWHRLAKQGSKSLKKQLKCVGAIH